MTIVIFLTKISSRTHLGDMPPLLPAPDAMVRDDLLFLTDFLPLADDEDFYEALAGPDLLDPASGRSAIDGARGKLSKDDIINKGVPSIAICCFKESQVLF